MSSEKVVRDSVQACASRRMMLVGAGAVGLTGVLAACGSTDDTPTAASTTAGPAASSSGAATEGSDALAATADVPVGGGIVANGVLIVQPTAGTFKAYNAACPHQGVQVAAPSDGISTCPAHKSTFSITDGARISGPATTGLTAIAVSVDGTNVVKA